MLFILNMVEIVVRKRWGNGIEGICSNRYDRICWVWCVCFFRWVVLMCLDCNDICIRYRYYFIGWVNYIFRYDLLNWSVRFIIWIKWNRIKNNCYGIIWFEFSMLLCR